MTVRKKRLVRDLLYPIDLWRSGDLARWSYLREFERTQHLPLAAIRETQLRRLRKLLGHAYAQCPYYTERFDRAGVRPGDLKGVEDLQSFPILNKTDIQESRDAMVARGWPKDDLIPNYTGGSTGAPLRFYMSSDRERSRWAATVRHNRWAGWDLGDRFASIWGALGDAPVLNRRQRLRKRWMEPSIFLNTANLTEGKLAGFHEEIRRFRPEIILGYARSVALFAGFVLDRGLPVDPPRAIVTSAEMLDPGDRALIEEAFRCPVFNRYGCREVSVIATECEAHRGLHTMSEGLVVEIVKAGRWAEPGEPGEILVTDLLNLAMPLIRYRIGDMGAWDEGPCPCGRELPRIGQVSGRTTDFLVGHDGRLVSGPFLTLAAVGARPSLGQLQIVQEQAGQVCFRIKRGPRFQEPADLDFLRETARKYLGEGAEVAWEFVEELPVTASGKYLFCTSKVTPEYLRCSSRP